MPHLISVTVGGHREPWMSLGLSFQGSASSFGDVGLVVDSSAPGIRSWTLGVESIQPGGSHDVVVDGIPTRLVSAQSSPHANGGPHGEIGDQKVVGVDHVVINTGDPERTCSAISDVLGIEVRRQRDVGDGVEQRFFKLDNTIIEVVSGPHLSGDAANLWGMVISVDDLFELAESLGPDVTSLPKRATQPGRFISTVRSAVGLGVPFAMMTPHLPGMATR